MLMRRVNRVTGEQQWLLTKSTVLHGGDGRPELVMNVTEDVTATTRAELGRRLLVEAGRLLSETDRLRGVAAGGRRARRARARGLVRHRPARARRGSSPGRGRARRAAQGASWRASCARGGRCTSTRTGVTTAVIRTGGPHAASWSTRRCSTPRPSTTEQLAVLRELGLSAALCVPLRSRRRGARRAHARLRAGATAASTSATRSSPRRSPAGSATRCATRACCATAPRSRTCSRRAAARPVAAAAGLRGRRRLPAGGRRRRGRRRLLRGHRRARRARS